MPRQRGRAYICNISTNEFFISRTYRQYHILPCPRGQSFQVTIIEDSDDRLDMGDEQYMRVPIAAEDIAEDLVRNEGIAVHGCFVIEGPRPTQAEMDAGYKIMLAYYKRMLAEGDGLWEKYHRHEMIDDNSRRAALFLGEEREWAFQAVMKVDCPGCSHKVKTNVAKCPNCGYILDIDRATAGGLIDESTGRRLKDLRKKLDKGQPKTAPVEPEAPRVSKGGGQRDTAREPEESCELRVVSCE